MRHIKIKSKRNFKKVIAQMLSLRINENQNTFYHNRNVNIKSFRGCKVVKMKQKTATVLVMLGYSIFLIFLILNK